MQTLLQGLGGYTRGCADAPPRRKLYTFEDQIRCRGGAHPYTFGRPLREGEGDFIALCKQRLQKVTGSKPSKSTNTLPPAWQFSLSWGGASADEEHRVLGRHYDQAARDCEEQPLDRTGLKGCPSRKLSSSFSSTEDFAGGASWRTAPSTPPPRK